ncbi:MAG TPA: bifunctional [glutamate--ammonia ligase]-adenylyl-L-tyrosine phosphorylase/[glutamate--ammonia-ligase] adenylyltransferase, partial [Verrucomicrobiae bacterium]|nr:bifunctional [glutamate--ammonia ligase]-adenylyl-L-tyrosine phosphorylase/[glutamate--ammonia-ligase] adenylyltransferase [Verrucomicrobiae bacterium]
MKSGLSPAWKKAVNAAPDPERAAHHVKELGLKDTSAEQARILATLFSGSPASADLLRRHPDWLAHHTPELLRHPRREQGMRRELGSATLAQIQEFKQREMVRIAARDLAQIGDLPQITEEISAVADVCLSAVFDLCRKDLNAKHGTPYHLDVDENWQPTECAVLGMGKLGGKELNYSSDVDLLFVYSDEGGVFRERPKKGARPQSLKNHQYFKRLAESFIAEVTRLGLYRIDMRLRPEGDQGPLARSLGSYETYYVQWGQAWERMMLIKARTVAGDESLGAEFLEMVQPFRYPRSVDEGFLREIGAMKDRIEQEVVKAGEIHRNVKLGRGGIREIEFVAQSLQVIHAGRIPFLQTPQTLAALKKLVQYHLLKAGEVKGLDDAYCFLRNLEHRLQMENYLQTHTIPTSPKAQERIAGLMGFGSGKQFEAALASHTNHVRAVYEQLFKGQEKSKTPPLEPGSEQWKRILEEHSYRDPEKCLRLLIEFANGPGYVHVSPRTVELAMQLIPKFLALCPKRSDKELKPRALSDPDRVLTRIDTFITGYGSRAMLFEAWAGNPAYFELMLLLFDRSEFLAELAIRTPDLVDGLVMSGYLRRRKTSVEILNELRHGHEDEDQLLWLRRYHQTELMRIGLRDILGLADFEQNLTELSGLADACLEYATESVLRKHRIKKPPFVIIGFGKLGGQEINYGSDLDLMFVAEDRVKNLPKLQRIATEILDMLSRQTELGIAFVTDTRLRPDGEKGLLVNTLQAYEDYYRKRAQLWELQALSRRRVVAGDRALGERFEAMAARFTDFSKGGPPNWKSEIARMRQRIEKERTPRGQQHLAIKTGAGGLIDAEFMAQAFCLERGWNEPNTLRALERVQQNSQFAIRNSQFLPSYRQLRRVEGILRRWSFAGETVLPD